MHLFPGTLSRDSWPGRVDRVLFVGLGTFGHQGLGAFLSQKNGPSPSLLFLGNLGTLFVPCATKAATNWAGSSGT